MNDFDVEILHFDTNDLAYAHYAEMSTDLLFSQDLDSLARIAGDLTLNQVICLSEASQYIQDGLQMQWLDADKRTKARDLLTQARRVIGSKLGSLTTEILSQEAPSLSTLYHARFISTLVHFNSPILNEKSIIYILKSSGFHLRDLLRTQKFVDRLDPELSKAFPDFPEAAEVLLSAKLRNDSEDSLFIPKGVDSKTKRSLIDKYVASESANPNYLQMISTAPGSMQSWITPQSRYVAHNRNKQRWDEYFEENSGIDLNLQISLDPDLESIVETDFSSGCFNFKISTAYLLESMDYPSILNNFIYVFGMTHPDGTLRWPSSQSEYTLVDHIRFQGDAEYRDTVCFQLRSDFYLLAIAAYSRFLKSQEIDLESVVAWFFQDYLVEEFGIENFAFEPTPPSLPTRARTRELLAKLENIFRQFTQLCQQGEINPSMTSFYSDPIKLSEIPSLIPEKTAELTEKGSAIAAALFSDQSSLNYLNADRSAETFVQLISQNHINVADFAAFQQSAIRELEQELILRVEPDGEIGLANKYEAATLRTAWVQGGVQRRAPTDSRLSVTGALIQRSLLANREGFFTSSEADFYNFVLNRKFTNGLNIRNKYAHGNEGTPDENEQLTDYLQVLLLMIGTVIKINDELEIRSRTTPRGESLPPESR
ncbi:hypothetical protein [Corynebacterium sp. CQ3829_602738]